MKIRTDRELFGKIDGELSWRRADIVRFRGVLINNRSHHLVFETLLRSSIPILYAHWEGFIKEVSISYLNFISLRKFPYKELNKGVLSLFIQNEFLQGNNLNGFEKALAISLFYETKMDERSNINSIPDPIKTKANLNSSILKEIIQILELDYEPFRGFEKFIDSKLLEARNKIAHGEYREIDWAFYDDIQTNVIKLIEEFRDQIQNQVVLKKYIKVA